MKTFALIALAGVASNATAQDMIICVEEVSAGSWEITAEFVSNPPATIDQLWADTSFDLNGSAITINSYNPSYDTTLGNAVITGNGSDSVNFTGNSNAFFGTPDPSNPLAVLSFTASSVDSLVLTGQNSALFDDGSAFGLVELYQSALGEPGTRTWAVEIKPIPAPASAALLGLGGLAAARRRR